MTNGADQQLIIQSITFIRQFLWYFTVTVDNFKSNVLSTQKRWASWLFLKKAEWCYFTNKFQINKAWTIHHAYYLVTVQESPRAEGSESPFTCRTLQTLKEQLFYRLTSLIFNKTSSIRQVVRVCKCEFPGKLCSRNRASLRGKSCHRLLQQCIKQDDDLRLRTRSPGKLLCLPIFRVILLMYYL